MGIVVNQTFKNTVVTYIGFAIGALNTLFLYTNFLKDDYYGVVAYLLSASNIMMPILAFGVQNALIKFYTSYKDKNEQSAFTAFMLLLPLVIIVPVGILGAVSYDWIVSYLTQKNEILQPYVWTIYVLAFSMAYFEVFYAWAKVNMKSVYGNFLKEVYHRVVVMVLLFMVFFNILSVQGFIYSMMGVYFSRMLLMLISAYLLKKPVFIFKLPANYGNVLKYSFLIILAGSIAAVLLDIDKVMLGMFKEIENIAYYNVAVFIAVVIAVPARSMHQIVYPITSSLLNGRNFKELDVLYKKSSINLFIIGGFIFLLILLNINEMYKLLPSEYSGGVTVVFLISLAKLFDNLIGNNNAIIFNSDYYRMVLFFGVFLAFITVLLNMIFIPLWGINGAAFATFLAFSIYNGVKLYFVKVKLEMQPFTIKTFKTAMLIIITLAIFYYWDFNFNPIINIVLKSALIGIFFGGMIYKLKLSEDINSLIHKYIKIKSP
ncbi:lipopolysaccharide biosynthesis protein [Galbibacter pacificus]|uniref:Polysaccharide biosynthesis C-terminal domain-containing protein n=1 Tax=Galbibacter pacificus TaxID=2996052 RepID=A0ABT6FQQ3_9FLAO|nr:polysaccharide biosynthesis C-terminal domain-containing protein [Galbibacter pacificus]MDG3581923.1 polysaccharide biosynthesis C-terminal domain-containing protein [Galbibacter pacificus]MDG3585603.1 polysaccharide biosynthesis C-terminal domain-containing protein [Galbibacter pacificus]